MIASARRRSVHKLWLLALALAVTALGPGAASAAAGSGGVVGAAYSETNGVGPTGNEVIVYDRLANGQLVQREVVPTASWARASRSPAARAPARSSTPRARSW